MPLSLVITGNNDDTTCGSDWPLFGGAFIQYLDHKSSTGFFSPETSRPFGTSARKEWNPVGRELLILRN